MLKLLNTTAFLLLNIIVVNSSFAVASSASSSGSFSDSSRAPTPDSDFSKATEGSTTEGSLSLLESSGESGSEAANHGNRSRAATSDLSSETEKTARCCFCLDEKPISVAARNINPRSKCSEHGRIFTLVRWYI